MATSLGSRFQRLMASGVFGAVVYGGLWAIVHSLIELDVGGQWLRHNALVPLVQIGVLAAVVRFYEVDRRDLEESRKRQLVRLVHTFEELQRECASVVSGATRYIISVGGVSRCPRLLRAIEIRLSEKPGLRHYRLLPEETSADVNNYLGRLLATVPNLTEGPNPTLYIGIQDGRALDLLICGNEHKVVFTFDAARLLGGEPLAIVVRERFVVDAVYDYVINCYETGPQVHSVRELPRVS
jgi:hypothetical protein